MKPMVSLLFFPVYDKITVEYRFINVFNWQVYNWKLYLLYNCNSWMFHHDYMISIIVEIKMDVPNHDNIIGNYVI